MMITKKFFALFLNLFALGIFLLGFTMSFHQQSLYWHRLNDSYSTLSVVILDRIFLIVHRTFLLSYFRGWLLALGFFCAQSMWSYNEAIIELAAAIFMKRLQQHGHEFRDETKLLAKAGGRCLQGNLWYRPLASMTSRLASVTFKMASKVFIEETDKNFYFITEIPFRFLGFGDFKVSIVIEN